MCLPRDGWCQRCALWKNETGSAQVLGWVSQGHFLKSIHPSIPSHSGVDTFPFHIIISAWEHAVSVHPTYLYNAMQSNRPRILNTIIVKLKFKFWVGMRWAYCWWMLTGFEVLCITYYKLFLMYRRNRESKILHLTVWQQCIPTGLFHIINRKNQIPNNLNHGLIPSKNCHYQVIINIIDYSCAFSAMTYQNISHEKGLWHCRNKNYKVVDTCPTVTCQNVFCEL